ncbi:MAG: DUF3048 domain-containing protein [Acidimicrobiales bacterium]
MTNLVRIARAAAPRHARSRRSGASRTWIFVALAVLVLGGGSAAALTIGHQPATPTTTLAAPTTSTVPPGPPCPLTGVPSVGSVPARPALAIKVDNYPAARPQAGLDKADIVFEEPVEGGITRYVAVFQCQQSSLVGNIRSARAVDVPILDQLSHPLFVHVGGINPVLAMIAGAPVTNEDLGYYGSIIEHVQGRYAPYSTYVSTEAAWGLHPNDTTPPSPIFTYDTTPPAGSALSSLHIPYSSTSDETWTWDTATNRFLLAYSGVPDKLDDGNQISVANVVVMKVAVSYGPWLENSEGGLEVQSQLTGSGSLMVLRNGEEITGTWQRSSLLAPATLVSSSGTVIPLAPGPTWVAIVPEAIAVTPTP